MSNKYTSVYDWLKYIKANVVGINLRELRISSSSINLLSNTELRRNCVNIGVLAMANTTINEVLPSIQKDKNIVFHFNIKVSNKERDGFHVFEDFDYVVRLCGRIPNSLLTIEQQAIMALGMINCIGDQL